MLHRAKLHRTSYYTEPLSYTISVHIDILQPLIHRYIVILHQNIYVYSHSDILHHIVYVLLILLHFIVYLLTHCRTTLHVPIAISSITLLTDVCVYFQQLYLCTLHYIWLTSCTLVANITRAIHTERTCECRKQLYRTTLQLQCKRGNNRPSSDWITWRSALNIYGKENKITQSH